MLVPPLTNFDFISFRMNGICFSKIQRQKETCFRVPFCENYKALSFRATLKNFIYKNVIFSKWFHTFLSAFILLVIPKFGFERFLTQSNEFFFLSFVKAEDFSKINLANVWVFTKIETLPRGFPRWNLPFRCQVSPEYSII